MVQRGNHKEGRENGKRVMENFSGWSNKAIEHELPNLDEFDRTRAEFELKLRQGQGMYEREPKQEEQPALPDMELVNMIESMHPEERIENKRRWLAEISDREMLCRMVDDANHAEGLDIEIIY